MMTKLVGVWMSVLALAAVCIGCGGGPITSLSSHTLEVAPQQQVDVVWVVRGDYVYRCTGSGGQPGCTPVDLGR